MHLSHSSQGRPIKLTAVVSLGRWLFVIHLLAVTFWLIPLPLLAEEGDDDAPGEEIMAASLLAPAERPVINEVLYNPANSAEALEFVEIYNPSNQTISLANWTLSDGIDYLFPASAVIPAKGFLIVAQNPEWVRIRFGNSALGPWEGKLSNEGDGIRLRDHQALLVDSVEYGGAFPWPTVGDAPDRSIGLLNAVEDNELPGNWRSGPPTPGAVNHGMTDNPPPSVQSVVHQPQSPQSGSSVQIVALATDTNGIAAATLLLQVVDPGAYIPLNDPRYASNWTPVPMQVGADGKLSATVPAWARGHRKLIRYRITVIDTAGATVTLPYSDDPQPNFAYYVYDALPIWDAAIHPNANGEMGRVHRYDFSTMRQLPIYQLLARQSDVADSQHIPNATKPAYMGNDYPWRGTFVYNGVVYDHIGFRARGGIFRYAVGKNHWKFDFLRGHSFRPVDNWGRPYGQPWEKMNFSSVMQHDGRRVRGEQGLFESLSYRLFNLFGVPASHTHFVHFRIVSSPNEVNATTQYQGDFWGLYLAIEEMDSNFLAEHGLPDGNLYEMKIGEVDLDNQGFGMPADSSDIRHFIAGYRLGAPPDWWKANFDLKGYYSFRSILEAVHYYDLDKGKNYDYFNNYLTGRWSILPWDLDLTWSEKMYGYGAEPFRDRVLSHGEFQIEYQNRLRELRDLLWNPEQIYTMIDEYANMIDTPTAGLSMVDADRARWDYNPLLESSYVVPERANTGRYYLYTGAGTFRGMAEKMKEYLRSRQKWIDETLLTDENFPNTPSVLYQGPGGYPVDQLLFAPSAFSDPQGPGTFAAYQYRAAEIIWPGYPGYDPAKPYRYEVEATWTSGEIYNAAAVKAPAGACRPGIVCRVRVRTKDNSGRWSHWSSPVQFVAGNPAAPAATTLAITEIHYHPLSYGNLADDELEFIELQNQGAAPLDLGGYRFSAGIEYTFPPGVQVAPGGYLVLASNSRDFQKRYGITPLGRFGGKLANGGETITLLDSFERQVISVTYDDKAPWPDADGNGYSLVTTPSFSTSNASQPSSWRASTASGGSPASEDPLPVIISELMVSGGPVYEVMVELYNAHNLAAPVGRWMLTDGGGGFTYPLAANSVVPANGYLTIHFALPAASRWYTNSRAELILQAVGSTGQRLAYNSVVEVVGLRRNVPYGRVLSSDGHEHFVLLQNPTPNAPNGAPQLGPAVISRIFYRAGQAVEFVEITNLTDQPLHLYDAAHPDRRWLLGGLLYQFPAGSEIPANGRLIVAAGDPAAICMATASGGNIPHADTNVRVAGPYAMPLSDSGQWIGLLQPRDDGVAGAIFAVADEVNYASTTPWPVPGATALLERNNLGGLGDDPANWVVGNLSGAEASPLSLPPVLGQPAAAAPDPVATVLDLCTFDIYLATEPADAAVAQRTTDGETAVAGETLTLTPYTLEWVTLSANNVAGFHIWRGVTPDRAAAVQLTSTPISATLSLQPAFYRWADDQAVAGKTYTYWLEAVNANNQIQPVGFSTPRRPMTPSYFPVVSR